MNTKPTKRTKKINPVDHRDTIDWTNCNVSQLYLLQYYGKTLEIRNRAKRELLKGVKA